MELQQFVAVAIREIVMGLNEAHETVKSVGGIVNPRNVVVVKEEFGSLYGHIGHQTMMRPVHKVDFDVAVTASEGRETKGGIGIAVASIGLGSSGKSDTSQSMTSRIKFSVPIAYPEQQ